MSIRVRLVHAFFVLFLCSAGAVLAQGELSYDAPAEYVEDEEYWNAPTTPLSQIPELEDVPFLAIGELMTNPFGGQYPEFCCPGVEGSGSGREFIVTEWSGSVLGVEQWMRWAVDVDDANSIVPGLAVDIDLSHSGPGGLACRTLPPGNTTKAGFRLDPYIQSCYVPGDDGGGDGYVSIGGFGFGATICEIVDRKQMNCRMATKDGMVEYSLTRTE